MTIVETTLCDISENYYVIVLSYFRHNFVARKYQPDVVLAGKRGKVLREK